MEGKLTINKSGGVSLDGYTIGRVERFTRVGGVQQWRFMYAGGDQKSPLAGMYVVVGNTRREVVERAVEFHRAAQQGDETATLTAADLLADLDEQAAKLREAWERDGTHRPHMSYSQAAASYAITYLTDKLVALGFDRHAIVMRARGGSEDWQVA